MKEWVCSKNLSKVTQNCTHTTLLRRTECMCLCFPNNELKIYPEELFMPNKADYSWS